ncbi:hypothetical protein TVAG_434670 [Trichomonas vaginalis G3]|uniref:Uncharacterized protein n=1 Tax=Trichomonas vaginalis (strain ATCC PRA-98 / G3) TaxID=412133 RepID=A2DSQ0_TRIV3|nr:hypothetical protein TVAGG3_0376820 [Trichomonas vaginalis G3]EAY16630.1 hypothetical protein TVAG_434670 [Trichomonas vaginalis G3]KAI5533009.1 hypothetical protein TVAGG3_0376820 [Trichomonas vaginalis G3]|eukprot:XP_001328853.1 hypothetical protein [Trichomonas vaginalis G3]
MDLIINEIKNMRNGDNLSAKLTGGIYNIPDLKYEIPLTEINVTQNNHVRSLIEMVHKDAGSSIWHDLRPEFYKKPINMVLFISDEKDILAADTVTQFVLINFMMSYVFIGKKYKWVNSTGGNEALTKWVPGETGFDKTMIERDLSNYFALYHKNPSELPTRGAKIYLWGYASEPINLKLLEHEKDYDSVSPGHYMLGSMPLKEDPDPYAT